MLPAAFKQKYHVGLSCQLSHLPVVDLDVVVDAVHDNATGRAGWAAEGSSRQVPGDRIHHGGPSSAAAEVPEVVGGVVGSIEGGDVGGSELRKV